jgi:hypothetical protein
VFMSTPRFRCGSPQTAVMWWMPGIPAVADPAMVASRVSDPPLRGIL